ncbi:hypothetical protein [Paraburkholderia sp. RL17-337-BIB-A]|uniref:hypothetical protein n=1 Tax=Paraburkholderia sp. RL17-337-BIB-A TaxID=3031636 RepID=UPI0038BAF0A9
MNLQDKVKLYRCLRKRVYEDATAGANAREHKVNQSQLENRVLNICNGASIANYQRNTPAVQSAVWAHMWQKIQYAGIRTGLASSTIASVGFYFNDWTNFDNPAWDVGESLHKNFMERTGVFSNVGRYVANEVKLNKTVKLARKYAMHLQSQAPLSFVTGNHPAANVWDIHAHLLDIGYTRDITALHLMMDLGFKVIKPDIVVTTLFFKLGWLHQHIPGLPANLTVDDLTGEGNYGGMYVYNTKQTIYKAVIDIALQIANAASQQDLRNDIDWVSNNPTRELDIFFVKFDQSLETDWGLTRTLSKEAEAGGRKLRDYFDCDFCLPAAA